LGGGSMIKEAFDFILADSEALKLLK